MKFHTQHAALPYVCTPDGVEVCLITSRDIGRWVIPKGWPKGHLSASALAEREAIEEAGLVGKIESEPFGSFTYRKRLHFFTWVLCRVDVYLFHVDHQMVDWAERGQRRISWFSPQKAASLVQERELAEIFLRLDECDPERLGQAL